MADETTKECACGECDTVTWCSREPLYVGSYVVSHIWLCNACVVKRAQARKQQTLAQADEPRAIIRAFALLGMERKLAANDGKGGWRGVEPPYQTAMLLSALDEEVRELAAALAWWRQSSDVSQPTREQATRDVLDEACDVALYAMMICDVIGALPPTDERGR